MSSSTVHRRREREQRRGGARQRRAAPLEQRHEPRQHEKQEYGHGDGSRRRQHDRIDRCREDASSQLLVAIELVGETRERGVQIAALFAGAHESDVEWREERAMVRQR
jgi:hypothetical protein